VQDSCAAGLFIALAPEEAIMISRITLTITEGPLAGRKLVLHRRGRYILGRADDCDFQLLSDGLGSLSRHHCVLIFEPPLLRIRDLGSRNGTYVNGEKIGQRAVEDPLADNDLQGFDNFELNDGDQLRLGNLVFEVSALDRSKLPALVH
jgi:pSer/pThr/pTyr-binding forkhead associated (FHA) protein